METYVIVGTGVAGGRAAETLRSEGFDGRVILVGAEAHPPYERPPLSKEIILGTKNAEDAHLFAADFYGAKDVELITGMAVSRLLPSEHKVERADGSVIPADKVLLCTGSTPRRLEVPGADLDGVHYLRTLDDAAVIGGALREGASVVVVGGGFIGAELAASARSFGNPVTVLEIDELPLRRVLGDVIGERFKRLHESQGVRVRTGLGVRRIEGDRRVRRVVTTGGETIDADLVVVGIGVNPAAELAAECGLAVDNGVVVDEFCRTSHPDVYAAGDVANHPNPILGERLRLEHDRNAQSQAIAAARSMLGKREVYAEVPWFWSDQYDLNLQVAGHPRASDTQVWRGDLEELACTAFYLRDEVLVGAVGFNRPRDVRSAMCLIAKRARLEPGLLADPATDLHKLNAKTGSA
jgi:3-phenylpropionate/trans-cinnamate dioxygenase ferredoxin reductase component